MSKALILHTSVCVMCIERKNVSRDRTIWQCSIVISPLAVVAVPSPLGGVCVVLSPAALPHDWTPALPLHLSTNSEHSIHSYHYMFIT